jgi:hypothetical protein
MYAIFEECAEYTFDPYWQEIFNKCAKGKFPKGMKYNPEKKEITLRLDPKKPIEVMPISEDDATETFTSMMIIFKEKLRLKSVQDIELKKDEINIIKKHLLDKNDTEWSKKPKHLKENMMMRFIQSLRETYELSDKEVKQLMATITLLQQFHQVESTDIILSPDLSEIVRIESLEFDSEKRSFYSTHKPQITTKTEKTNRNPKIYSFIDSWLKEEANRITF